MGNSPTLSKFVTPSFLSRHPKSSPHTLSSSSKLSSLSTIKTPKQILTNGKLGMDKTELRKLQKPLSDCSNAFTVNDNTASTKRLNPSLSSVVKTIVNSLTTNNDAVSDRSVVRLRRPFQVLGTGGYEVLESSSVNGSRQTSVKRKKSTGKENDVPLSSPRTPNTRSLGKKTKRDGGNTQSRIDTTPTASTPTPRVSSSTPATISRDVFEPSSVYSRRQTAQKWKSNRSETIGASSCPPALKIRNTCDNSNEDGKKCLSKKSKAPRKTKILPAKKEKLQYTSPELEKQKAYFEELDKDELEEAEESELSE